MVGAGMPEWSKGADLRSAVYLHAWVRTPLSANVRIAQLVRASVL